MQRNLFPSSETTNANYQEAIRLLTKFGMIDNPANIDISVDQQSLIKRELLSLPDTCKGLAWYSDIYGKNRTGEVAVSYKNEVLGILIDGIPSLRDIKLTGVKYGFRPA